MINRWIGLLISGILACYVSGAQEHTAPIKWNGQLADHAAPATKMVRKGTALTLPFFEDFTDLSPYPNSNRWTDSNVYINNTMCVGQVSRGVATFDALNKYGRPYDTVNRLSVNYADSLTSQPFNLGTYLPRDSIYMSFFYQPQGNGFSPDPTDSLMLYFHRQSGGWDRVWTLSGTGLQPFKQVFIPVTDTAYLYDGFQFRFLNIASINTNDDIWNLDYIRINAGRTRNDTLLNDLAFTTDQTSLLNDYVSMPYRQFIANAANERAANFTDSIRNYYPTTATLNYGYRATELTTGGFLSSSTGNVPGFPANSGRQVSFPVYTALPSAPSATGKMVFETVSYLQSGNPNEPKSNDTLTYRQIFDNYLAYDDGSAEKSYYLNLFSSLPGKTAIEHRLNQPDTLQGLAIYFGQQVPTASTKPIGIAAYKTIAGINSATKDSVIARVDDLYPLYTDSVNKFTVYRFLHPVLMSAGTFYVGYIQPANSGSDSLYIGLDVNRIGTNHLYYNVLGTWQSSTIRGALMVRPLLGGPVTATGIKDATGQKQEQWYLYPNPVTGSLSVKQQFPGAPATAFAITDLAGHTVMNGPLYQETISVSSLTPGLYFIRLLKDGRWSIPQKIIKQ